MIRCHGESLQSIRKSLLRSLNLQVEPQLPAGWLDSVREQWKSSFSSIAHIASDAAGTWNLKHRRVCRPQVKSLTPPPLTLSLQFLRSPSTLMEETARA